MDKEKPKEDIEKFRKLVQEKKISTVEEMQKESKRYVEENIPNFKEKYLKATQIRGDVIEGSIILETAFNEILSRTGGESFVIDDEKKELHFITGIKKEENLRNMGFNSKIRTLKKVLRKRDDEITYRNYIQSEGWKKKNDYFKSYFKKCKKCGSIESLNSCHISYENFGKENTSDVEVLCWYCQIGRKTKPIKLSNQPDPPLLADLERIGKIRDIFAHVPINWISGELEFNDKGFYEHYFRDNPKWVKVEIAFLEFKKLSAEILELIPHYIRSILLEEKIMASMIFGTIPDHPKKDLKKS
jgi:hypothetical protein